MQLQTLIRRWKSDGVRLLPPESRDAVETAFGRLGSRATRDVITLFAALGGMEEMDAAYLRLWSLREMEEDEVNADWSQFGPVFADYLINCWCFRLRPVDDETSAVYVDRFDRSPPRLVAPSLAEFLAAYERDPSIAEVC